ncbi:MAG: peptidyl-prolyl cis-trans isomerase [Verrucomicrobia bacterium]|nr:peptidyl-prolyl cis-trans isomerase [Verrucomicrobiota bacterium]
MLKFLRRHNKTLFLVVTAIVIISFTFMGSYTKTGNRPGTVDDLAFTIHGQEHDFAEYNRLSRYYQISQSLRLSLFGGRAGFADSLVNFAPRFKAREEIPRDFVFNLMLLRYELEKNGIHASDAEVKEQFRSLPVFQTNGELDRAKLEGFENSIGIYGMRVSDVYDLIRDWLGLQKLITVVAGNAVPSSYLAKQFYAATCQTIQVATIPFVLENFKKTAEVSDDEIKKYFEQKKDQFKTAEKRAVSFVLFETPQGLDKLTVEERIKKNGEYSKAVEDFSNEGYAGRSLDELAKKHGKEIKSLPAFAQTELPEELKKEQELAYEIFRNDPKKHLVSDPVQSEKGYYFFTVSEVQESKPQELADAQPKIKEILIAQKAQEAMMKAANDARKELGDAIQAGKKFDDAAKEAKLEPQNLPEFTPTEPPKDLGDDGYKITAEAQQTPAGSFSKKLLETDNGVLLVFVKSKELRKREDSATMRVRIDESLAVLAQRELISAWFDRRRDDANVKSNLPDRM